MHVDTADRALRNLRRLMGRDPLLRDLVQPILPESRRPERFSPDVDVVEADDAYTITIDLPGVPKDKVSVQVQGARLVVRGEKPEARPSGRTRVTERSFGAFSREFLLPLQVASDAIRAQLDEGVLTITLPRSGTAGERSVHIE